SGWPAECRPPGLLADGAPCGLSVQCRSARCKGSNGVNCGTCVSQVPDGAPCVAIGNCGRNSFCYQQVCVPRVSLGGSCGTGVYCLGLLECISLTGNGVCSKPPGLGERCNPDDFLACDDTYLVCDATTLTCTEPKSVGIGEAC